MGLETNNTWNRSRNLFPLQKRSSHTWGLFGVLADSAKALHFSPSPCKLYEARTCTTVPNKNMQQGQSFFFIRTAISQTNPVQCTKLKSENSSKEKYFRTIRASFSVFSCINVPPTYRHASASSIQTAGLLGKLNSLATLHNVHFG